MYKFLIFLIIIIFGFLDMAAQAVKGESDSFNIGYLSRPYLRYEAEPGFCKANDNQFIMGEPQFNQHSLQAEASNNCAVSLSELNDKVEWIADSDADAFSLRFSIPDNIEGTGNVCTLGFYVNGLKAFDIKLNSFWSWQYFPKNNNATKHPDNKSGTDKFARMKFDEIYMRLPDPIKTGDAFAIVKDTENAINCTIDFIELEKIEDAITFEQLSDPKVQYSGSGSDLQNFINSNRGKTIYIPEGNYTIPSRIYISGDNTKIIGAGMWRTNLYFSADPDSKSSYGNRGFESYANGILLQGFSMNSASNMRYYDNNEAYGMGKGIQGSFGKNSILRDLRIDHFECGAWIGDYSSVASDGLLIEQCRFRNNYADGVNLCSGTKNAIVRNCSFRNNGDDDMASWSTGNITFNNEFSYCTVENNWRASGLGFFGGRGNKAHHISISDGLECGARITADFAGTGFIGNEWFEISDLYISRCGTPAGRAGESGDLWGNWQSSFRIQAGSYYDLNNIRIERVNIRDSRFHGFSITTNSSRKINNLELHNILIDGIPDNATGIFIASNVTGNGHYSNLNFHNVNSQEMSAIPSNFIFENVEAGMDLNISDNIGFIPIKNGVIISNLEVGSKIDIYTPNGILFKSELTMEKESRINLPEGLYIIACQGYRSVKILIE